MTSHNLVEGNQTHSGPDQRSKRLRALLAYLTLPPADRCSIVREMCHNAIVIIPTYTAKRRDLIDTTVGSILAQTRYSQTPSLTIVIADNGLSLTDANDLRQRIEAAAERHSASITLAFVNAHPSEPRELAPAFQKTAAFARNKAIAHIMDAGKNDPRFRGDVFCIDDDAALVGPSLPILLHSLHSSAERQAVVPSFITSTDITRDYGNWSHNSVEFSTAVNATKDLPPQFKNGAFDLSMAIAFSGDVSTKTAALAISRDLLNRSFSAHNTVFKVYPHGSFEDMSFGSVASRCGKIAHNPVAKCLDQARPDVESLKRQKIQWGRDHVQALSDFTTLGMLYNGITVLEPSVLANDPVWVQWQIPSSQRGVIINPSQLHRSVFPTLKTQIQNGIYEHLEREFDRSTMLATLHSAQALVSNILDYSCRGTVHARPDLGKPDLTTGPDGSRFHPSVLAYQVAGNLAGILDINGSFVNKNLKFVLGCRQQTIYESTF